MTTTNATWWASLYDDLLAEMLLVRTDEAETAATIAFLQTALDLAPTARILDQCCGIGSLAIPLARTGRRLVAIDQASAYIDRLRRDAEAAHVTIEAHAADAFDFRCAPPCDAVVNWWTSFGYAPDDATNVKMLARAFESLRPGGRFAIDTLHVPGVLRRFERDVVTRRSTPLGEVTLWRRSEIDVTRGTMLKRWSYFVDGRPAREHRSEVRLYMPDRLATFLRDVGFEDVRFVGGIDGAPLTLDSGRCIAIARRPT